MIDLGEDALNAINSSEAFKKTMELFGTTKEKVEKIADDVKEGVENWAKDTEEKWHPPMYGYMWNWNP